MPKSYQFFSMFAAALCFASSIFIFQGKFNPSPEFTAIMISCLGGAILLLELERSIAYQQGDLIDELIEDLKKLHDLIK